MGTLLKPTLEITNCRQCPYKIETNHSSSDGWDRMEDWECTGITGNKTIQHGVEWHEIGRASCRERV